MSRGRRKAPQPVDWSAYQYQPDPATPLRRCTCGAAYLDDAPSRNAHLVVFGHRPHRTEPAEPAKETQP